VIDLDNLTIAARGRTILDRATVTIPSDGITHLAGANGSGKTTLIRAIAGIQRHTGEIRFDGVPLGSVRHTTYVSFDDAPVFPFLSGYENLSQLLGRRVSPGAAAALAPAIADHALLRMPARRLSNGQRKRLHLLAALLSNARYLVLDEVFSGIDAPTAEAARVALERRSETSTILLTGHEDVAAASLASTHLELVDTHLRTVVPV
jgi:ABC-type multidrug transport system ATPase subunit